MGRFYRSFSGSKKMWLNKPEWKLPWEFDEYISDLKIFHRELSIEEIKRLAKGEKDVAE